MGHVVVGAGAVGLGIGSALLAAGEDVAFVARGETARALRREGLERTGLFGSARFPPDRFRILDSPAAIEAAPRAIWVATKAFATAEVARTLAEVPLLLDAKIPVVSLQNGLGNAEALAARIAPARVLSAAILIGFRRGPPNRVDVTVCARPLQLGSLFGADLGTAAGLVAALEAGGIPAAVHPEIGRELWEKALYNCALNPMGALLEVPYGALADQPATRAIMDDAVREIFAVMGATGERTHWDDAERYLAHFYEVLLPPTATHESSMLQDVRAGRRTEIDALCGEIVRRGTVAGVPTPVNRALETLIRAREARGGHG